MNQYVEYQSEVLVPVQIVEISFREKEEIALNAFQSFILEAIASGNKLSQIVEATLLTRNVVETEVVQMLSQKLLVREAENIILSDLSKKIQMISKSVINLNKEKKLVCINLMTGDIEAFDKDSLIFDKEGLLYMHPKITESDIDGISLEENVTFFENYMESFGGMDKSDIETVLSSVFVEFKTVGKMKYIKKTLCRIPCAIGGYRLNNQMEESITVRGLMYQVEYQVESDIINSYKNIMSELNIVNTADSTLLSQKGLSLLKQYKICENYNNEGLFCVYDTTSGQFHFEKQKINYSKNKRCNLQLPILYDLSDDIKNNIIEELKKHYSISDDFTIKEIVCNARYYNIDCELSDLWRKEHDKC